MALPTAPSRSMDQTTFDNTTDAFVGALPQFETDMNTLAAAMNLNDTIDTSSTSNSIATGSKTFTVTAGKSFVGGMWLVIADTAAPSTNSMAGQVTSYSGTTLVINVTNILGSGTKTAWTISQNAGGLYANLAGSASQTFSASNLQFPATQVPSANVNCLDDYEEGTWAPALSFVTNGDLSVTYTTQNGRYTKIGNVVFCSFAVVTTTFTHSTASGRLKIGGLPFTASSWSAVGGGALVIFEGITKANYTQFAVLPNSTTDYAYIFCSASGQTNADLVAADMPSGTTKRLYCDFSYQI